MCVDLNIRLKVNMTQEEQCSICLDELGKNYHTSTICGHKHHAKCLCEWYVSPEGSPTCPICRVGLTKTEAIQLLARYRSESIHNRSGFEKRHVCWGLIVIPQILFICTMTTIMFWAGVGCLSAAFNFGRVRYPLQFESTSHA